MALCKKRKKDNEDLKQFEYQITLIHKELYKFIFNIAKNKMLAQDALHNTLLIAYENYNSLKDKNKFKSWIYTIAKRQTISLITKYSREIPKEIASLQLVDSLEYFSIPEGNILDKELIDYVIQAINQLKSEQREVINLRYYNDLTFDEIEKVLNVNGSTLRVRHMRAKKNICEFLQKNYYNKIQEDIELEVVR